MDVYDFNLEEYVAFARMVGTDTEGVEIKAAVGGLPKNIVETLSAFANTSGGVLVLGLSEKNNFAVAEGFNAQSVADALTQACGQKMEPPVRASIEVVLFEGSPVVVAIVPETAPYEKPCYVKARTIYEGSFVRVGDGDRRLSPYEVDRILERAHWPQFDQQIAPEAEMGEFDPEMLHSFLVLQREESHRAFRGLTDEEVLETLKVAARDGKGRLRPTLAGLMAMGRYPQKHYPRAYVSFARYPGTSKADMTLEGLRFMDSKNIMGPIPVMISEVMSCVRRNMKLESTMKGAFRVEEWEYPEEAIREAVANALLHRDYSPEGLASQVQVNMYDDRIEVMSPGGLCGGMTVERLGELGASFARNQVLSRILESTVYVGESAEVGKVVENKGTGYFQIKSSLRRAGHPDPVPHDHISVFVLDLYGKGGSGQVQWEGTVPFPRPESPLQQAMRKAAVSKPDRVVRTVTAPSADGAHTVTMHIVENGSVEFDIIALLEETDEPMKSSQLIEQLGKSKATVSRALNRLIEKGLVERMGGRKGPGIVYRRTSAPANWPMTG